MHNIALFPILICSVNDIITLNTTLSDATTNSKCNSPLQYIMCCAVTKGP